MTFFWGNIFSKLIKFKLIFRSPIESSQTTLKFKGLFDPASLRQGNGSTVTIGNETVPIHPKFKDLIANQEAKNELIIFENEKDPKNKNKNLN